MPTERKKRLLDDLLVERTPRLTESNRDRNPGGTPSPSAYIYHLQIGLGGNQEREGAIEPVRLTREPGGLAAKGDVLHRRVLRDAHLAQARRGPDALPSRNQSPPSSGDAPFWSFYGCDRKGACAEKI